MAGPYDADWINPEAVNAAKLNKTTYGQGTSFPSTWATDRLFWRTDENKLYKNIGTVGSPVWQELTVINSVTSLPSLVSTYPANSLIDLKTASGNIYRAQDNISGTKLETIPPMRRWLPLTSYLSPPLVITNGAELALEEDFTQYTTDANILNNWTDASSKFTESASGNYIECVGANLGNNNTTYGSVLDLGSTLAANLVARFAIQCTAASYTSGNSCSIGLAIASTSVSDGNNDFIGYLSQVSSSGNRKWLNQGDNEGLVVGDQLFTDALSVETLYYELIKNGTTLTLEAFSDSGYTTSVEQETTTVTNFTNLRYIHLYGEEGSTFVGSNTQRLLDISIKNGVTTW